MNSLLFFAGFVLAFIVLALAVILIAGYSQLWLAEINAVWDKFESSPKFKRLSLEWGVRIKCLKLSRLSNESLENLLDILQ